MEVLSVYRGARMSAFKVRELTREIQGLAASAALDVIAFSSKKAALMVGKTLKSAIANAENNNELKVDTLVVKEATVGEGPTMRRIKSRARGSASPIRKRTSHIRIVLSDEIVLPQRNSVPRRKARRAASPASPPAPRSNRAAQPKAKTPATEARADEVETETKATPPFRRRATAPAKPPPRRSSVPTRTPPRINPPSLHLPNLSSNLWDRK